MKKEYLSEASHNIEGQPMFKVLDKVHALEQKGEDIIHFEIGDPDFPTPTHIINAATQALKDGFTHYTSSMGLYEMREAVAEVTLNSRGFKPDIDQVLVTPGANSIIYFAITCLVNPGEEVIYPDPGFPTYISVIKFLRAIPVGVPLKESKKFRMNPKDILDRITSKTRLIIINSPANPTGAVMTKNEIDEVYNIASKKGIYLLSDEIYSRMMYENNIFHSPSSNDKCKETTIVLNGFSKAFAMTGWRIGVAIAPKHIIDKMGLLIQMILSCVPPFIQKAAISALKGPQDEVKKMMEIYKKRRDILVDGLNNIKGISCVKGDGAFYAFPNITKTNMSSEEFADFMLDEAKVALLPGTNFGPSGKGFVRLTYATSIEKITEGLKRIKNALESI